MFWYLLLAHLIGDYPLQTGWIVQKKRLWWGRALHVSIHLAVLLAVVWPATGGLWPYLVALAVLHYGIDTLKNGISQRWPKRVNGPYLADQGLHLFSIVLVTVWIQGALPNALIPVAAPWVFYAIGYVFVTQAWYITEWLMTHENAAYQADVQARHWPRMAARAALTSIFLLVLQAPAAAATLLAVGSMVLPYQSVRYARRALITDVAVSAVAALFITMLA